MLLTLYTALVVRTRELLAPGERDRGEGDGGSRHAQGTHAGL